MSESKHERRSQRRIPVRTEVEIKSAAGSASGRTRDLNARGVFLYTDSVVGEGTRLELMLVLPPEVTGGQRQWACCQASIARVEATTPGGFGVAARIDRIEILPEIEG
jgi:hypothetical protein